MLSRRNHTIEQLGHTFRERTADVVDAPLPAEMQSLVLKLASAEPQRSRHASSHSDEIHHRTLTTSQRGAS
jgi:hypothetical protein